MCTTEILIFKASAYSLFGFIAIMMGLGWYYDSKKIGDKPPEVQT